MPLGGQGDNGKDGHACWRGLRPEYQMPGRKARHQATVAAHDEPQRDGSGGGADRCVVGTGQEVPAVRGPILQVRQQEIAVLGT
jgi:hypothetical protein